jgi:ADP-ribose pyrophosphatase
VAEPAEAADLADVADVTERWPVVATAELARGEIVRVRTDLVRMPDGEEVGREVIEHPGAVAVLAVDHRDRVLLIRQYRHAVGRLLWEIPAGLRDVDGEQPLAAAERELQEEAGYRAADWHVLADFYPSPGISTERLRIFLARGLTEVPAADQAFVRQYEEAYLVIGWLPLDQAVDRFLAGDLHNGVTAVGILAAYAARKGGFSALRRATAPEC